jgi:RNA polymerase sigma-70 factor (ECF subfamily)
MNGGASSEEDLARIAIATARELAGVPDLGSVLAGVVKAAVAAWPDVRVDVADFVAYLAERVQSAEGLSGLHTGDLYLACACALGNERAVAAFERAHVSNVGAFIARLGAHASDPAFVSEVQQALRCKLLLPSETGPAKIREYTGKGPLGGWLRIAAVRTALNMHRSARASGEASDVDDDVPAPGADPDLQFLKAQYRAEFRKAFATTLASLTADERNILRLHHIDGLTIDQLAALVRTPRSTVGRSLAKARQKILAETRRLLAEELKLEATELDSIFRAVESQLDMSIRRYLA